MSARRSSTRPSRDGSAFSGRTLSETVRLEGSSVTGADGALELAHLRRHLAAELRLERRDPLLRLRDCLVEALREHADALRRDLVLGCAASSELVEAALDALAR